MQDRRNGLRGRLHISLHLDFYCCACQLICHNNTISSPSWSPSEPILMCMAMDRANSRSMSGVVLNPISLRFYHNDPASIRQNIANLHHVALNTDVDNHLDLAIAPEHIAAFQALGLGGDVLHKNLGSDLKSEGQLGEYQSAQGLPDLSWFEEYHSYDGHLQYLKDLHSAFPNQSEIIVSGELYEGRPIQGIHIWGAAGKGANPAVLWHGTVQAREWITPKTTEYLTFQLISGYLDGTTEVVDIVDSYDLYVFPVVNSDGKGFSYHSQRDRLWRKSRQPRDGASCIGTDINRNWPYKWQVSGGASSDPCDETYRGEESGDTPDLQGIVSLVDELARRRPGHPAYILLPFGYDCDAVTDTQEEQLEFAASAAEIIEAQGGTAYTHGASCGHLYPTTGSSVDYLAAVAGAQLAWTVELRPDSSLVGGFNNHAKYGKYGK
ncbi:Zn-dependent exopeptidase [Sodiomyces alkalinus F11]|uniref:Zn-dependent exopeptidase n=1 Tax=Sodiomyces alkalinus (strain CBS 110278 / VKM F-3762 / F11) TaxID=1314773 RepID=A0A3N2Q3J9_SODAK|nr:Zn-dependent exopeptidase [Sodiomyces alkalinus F11]ROT41344.1 Zn-dependent exopeptidase [Sodiomyces alkalinus F11]